MRTTQRKGDIAVAQAIATFTKLGYDVALPLTESAAYDLVVEADKKMQRVQVRYSSEKNVELRRIHSNSQGYVIKKTKKNAYDWLYIFKPEGTEYLIKECLDSRRSVRPKEIHRIVVSKIEDSHMQGMKKDVRSNAPNLALITDESSQN
ncbi:MAG: group I intron-associated PD-(D/E)XK endonuclease [Patescibacteria group bacterium]